MKNDYNLIGRTIKVRRKVQKETDCEPWAYGEQKMRVIGEFPDYLRCLVLPHMNPKGYEISEPYTTCLDKHDIECGDIIINGGAIR